MATKDELLRWMIEARELLRDLVDTDTLTIVYSPTGQAICWRCRAVRPNDASGEGEHDWHRPDCAYRRAKEYLRR